MDFITYLSIAVIIYFIYKFFQQRNPEYIIEKLENQAELLRKDVRSNVIAIADDEAKALEEMEKKYIRLKERFKHDQKRKVKIAQDWYDYAFTINQIWIEGQLLGVSSGDDIFNKYQESVKEPRIKQEEIKRRFDTLLSADK